MAATPISDREAQVLAAVGAHLSNAQIAHHLSISVRTVESHVSALLRKLGARDRRELAELRHLAGARQPVESPRIRGLPVVSTSFVGRERERVEVLAALAEARLVTLVGPGGVGKTRLAIETVGGCDRPGAFVDLIPVHSGLTGQAVARVLGATERPSLTLAEAIAERLGHQPSLLILDNCEHVLADVAEFAARLSAACPQLWMLLTSRERLGLAGRTVPVAPLSLVAAGSGGPAGSDAERLFLDRAAAAGAEADEDPEMVRRLCARLDGMPLAIELAAARMPSMGPGGLLAALDDHLTALTGGRGADARHRSLRAVLDWSHNLLDGAERDLFHRLAVFAGGFDLAAAAAVAPHLAAPALADLLGRLTDKSLLVRERSRWRMLETVHAYALDQLGGDPEVWALHRAWCAAAAAGLTASARVDSIGWQEDFDAVVGDLRRVADGGDREVAHNLGHLLYARRFLTEARARYEQAGQFRAAADVAFAGARGDLAFELLTRSAAAAREAGDAHGHSTSLAYAVTVAGRSPAMFPRRVPLAQLEGYLAEARAAAPPGDPVVSAYLAGAEAWARSADQFSLDEDLARDALAAAENANDLALISCALDALSAAAAHGGRLREAYRMCRQRAQLLDLMPRHDPRYGLEIFDIHYMMVELAVAAGDLPGALTFAEAALDDDIAADLPHSAASKPLIPLVLLGRFDEAIELAERMWQGWQRSGAPTAAWMAASAYSLTIAYALRDDAANLKLWRERAVRIGRGAYAGPDRRLKAFMTFADARIALHANDFSRVEELLSNVDAHAFTGPYAAAATTELAVAAGLRPDLRPARAAAAENDWAAACYAHIRGRLGERGAFDDAVRRWETLGASLEARHTLELSQR